MRFQKWLFPTILAALCLCLGAAPGRAALPAGVQSFAPTGRVSDNVSFRLVFKNAVAAKKDVGRAMGVEEFPFEVTPAIQAEGKWQNETTFTARLLAPLRMGTSYTARLREGLTDRKGKQIPAGSFSFQTDALTPTAVKAVMGRDGARLTLAFNMPVAPAVLQGFLQIVNEKGEKLHFSLQGAAPNRSVQVLVPLGQSLSRQTLTVRIAAGLTSGEGNLGLAQDFSSRVVLEPQLTVEGIQGDEGLIQASFNFPIDPESVRDFVAIEPPVEFRLDSNWSGNALQIRGDFEPRSRFVVTLRRGLPSKEGGLALKEDFKQAVIMPDLEPSVSIPTSGTYLTAMGGGLIPLELVNVKKLQVNLWRLYENNIPYVIRGDYNSFSKDLARRVYSREFKLDLPLNEHVRRSLAVDELASGDRGLFLLSVRDLDAEYWDEENQILNLSDLGAVARVWEDGLMLWVNTLSGTQPVSDAEVRIYSGANQVIAQGKTDAEGIFAFDRPEPWGTDAGEQPRLAVISSGRDLTYVQLTRSLLSQETFDTAGRPWLREGYDAILFAPRDIYRTGEEVPFKAIVRGTDLSTPAPFPVLFTVRDPMGRRTEQQTMTLSDMGSALFTLKLPANALTGLWSAVISVPGREESPMASMNFHVEDFAPPRIEVKMSTDSKALTHGDDFKAAITARWLFGADGAGLRYKTFWSAKDSPFEPTQDRWKGYTFGDSSRKFEGARNDMDEGQLDASGRATSTLTLDAEWEAASTIAVTLRTEVMEDGGRWVSDSITLPYFPTSWLLGIAATEEQMAVNHDLTFRIAAIDPQEEPADPGDLTASLYRVRWNYNIVEVDGYRRWQSSEELTLVEEKPVTLKDGLGSVSFRPEEWGTYLVRVSDIDDNARAAMRFYASDARYAERGGSPILDRVGVSMDREFYRVGDTAKVTLTTPFEGLLLFSVEGARPISRQVRKVDAPEITVEVPVTQDMVPNGWITAWLVRPVSEEDASAWGTHRAVGAARLKADLTPYKLDVAMEAVDKVEPASTLPVSLTLKDAEGKPVQGDVALALVDDAVLGLTGYKTPDLLNHFWGLKKLNSEGYDLYDLLIPVESRATEPLHPAGGAGMAALAGAGSNVQRFKILSLFQGLLSADAEGRVKADLDVPEFSGRGRLFAVVASQNRFGMAEQPVQIARSVVTEVNLPRFAAPGDVFVAPLSIFNASTEARDVTLSISAEGGLKVAESQKTLRVEPGAQARWETEVSVLEPGDVSWDVVTSWTEEGGQKEYRQTIDLPIRSPWPVVSRSGSGVFESGTTPIDIPVSDFSGTISGTLSLADTPMVDLTRAVTYLLNYPYGCLEQTLSASWPFLVLPDAVSALDPLLVNDQLVRDRMETAMAKLQSMQLYDGSFETWPGTGHPYVWGSVYAAHFLVEAQQAGVDCPKDMLAGAMNWLHQFLASMPGDDYPTAEKDDFTAKAYATYVLARNGEKPLGWIEYLRENRENMWPSGRIWLAGAQAVIDGRGDALRELAPVDSKLPQAARWRTLESDVRNAAQLLSLWMEVEPQATEAVALAASLVKWGQENRWYSTQDNAAALMALARYNLKVGAEKANLQGTLTDGTKDLLTYKSGSASSIAASELPARVTLNVQGTGRGYYTWNVMGTPKSQPKAEKRGIDVECAWYDEKGGALDLTQPIPQGTRMQAVLTLKPSLPVSGLAVSCLLPAGLELENPRLDPGLDDAAGSYGVVGDVRDDRLLLFFDRLGGERTYSFKVRAVTRGTFVVPPISATGMYDPAVHFTGRGQPDLTIK